jgi:hypothetical protein
MGYYSQDCAGLAGKRNHGFRLFNALMYLLWRKKQGYSC